MPFVYDYSQVEWSDPDSDPPPPRAEEFVYIPPPMFGGARGPVHFTLDVPPEPLAPAPVAPVASPPRPSFWERLRGRQPSPVRLTPKAAAAAELRAAKGVFSRQRAIALSVAALRELDVRRLHCRYDGGNDEGFAWFDSAELRDGARLDPDALAQRLAEQKFLDRLITHGAMTRIERFSEREQVAFFLRGQLCDEWATMLLGRSYGAGEYVMYGAFVVDLDDCTVIDDPKADPVVNNIEIAR
jgi:hypothetical protein